MHQKNVRTTADVGMDRDGEDELIVLAIEVVEMIAPNVLHIARVDESMAIGCLFDEHHWWQIVDVPVGRNFHKSRLWAMFQGLHPSFGLLLVVDFGPAVAGAKIICLAVFVAHAMVVLDAVIEKKLSTLLTCFPPIRTY